MVIRTPQGSFRRGKDQLSSAPDLFMISFPGIVVNCGGANGIEERGEDPFLPRKIAHCPPDMR
jgi:hypothetical protein